MSGKSFIRIVSIALLVAPAMNISAQTSSSQTPAPKPAPLVQKKTITTTVRPARPVIVQNAPNAPQVVTLLHRLSGLKMFRLLLRSGEARAIERLDDAFTIEGDVHTNVIAGLALDDGVTVAAWMPEVDAEVGPPLPPTATTPKPPTSVGAPTAPTHSIPRGYGSLARRYGLIESPNLTVLVQDQKRLPAKYVGLDGLTGLSILKLPEGTASSLIGRIDATEAALVAGQRVHLFAPEPVNKTPDGKPTAIYARMGETEAQITRVMRSPGGAIARLRIRSAKLSPANIGGVVLNDTGQTIGIIDAVRANEATVLPANSVRNAAKRVLERQASVPRPWLGIGGESLEGLGVDHLLRNGWQPEVATMLAQQQQGILLTSVVPGSPASTALLRPGDVILSVNDGIVRTAEDFSWVLQEAGSNGSLKFTVARPGKAATEAVEVKLAEAPDPFFGLRSKFATTFNTRGFPAFNTSQYVMSASLLASGMETITLLPKVASKLGSDGGLLVVYVEPATAAYQAGVRPGDVIESINGQKVNNGKPFKLDDPGNYSYVIVRNKQKLVLTFDYKEKE